MPTFKAVKVNETKSWNPEFIDDYKITKMLGIYVYDPKTVTHCCELTPSYELHFVHSQVVCDEMDEEKYEEMYDQITDDNSYSPDVIYIHCRNVDRMELIDIGEFDSIEDAQEYCQGNHV